MQKTKNSKSKLFILRTRRKIAASVTIFVLVSGLVAGAFVHADQFDQQIQILRDQNASAQAQANSLASQANSYQQAIDALQGRINAMQQAIISTQGTIDALQVKITKAQADLEQQKLVLRENIRTMYLEGNISTLEILANSKDLSDFVDKEENRNAVASKVQDTMAKISVLKAQLDKQQREQKSQLAYQQSQRSNLYKAQAEQSRMLAFTEGQKAAYDKQIQSNNSKIVQLRAAQLAANQALGGNVVPGDPGRGSYPNYLYFAPKDSLVDPWGMFNRECVSYTAWKVQQAYGNMPNWGGQGNANQWPADARAAGIRTGSTPKVGSVAISMSGYYGHAMWVEAVAGSMIYVSQMNFDLQGHYSEMWVNGSSFTYLYFGG